MEFKPYFVLKNPHIQTLLSYVLKRYKEPESETLFVDLSDGDQLALEVSTPIDWKRSDPTVLMIPGTAGSHKSPYLVRLASKLVKKNVRAIRLNFRGIGSGFGRAKNISHGGSSNDVFEAIKAIKEKYPDSPLSVIGFSLSGNILLKLSSEKDLSGYVDKKIAVCPPLCLADSSKRLEKLQNRLYQRSIVKTIIDIVSSPKCKFNYSDVELLKKCKTLREVDEILTAPLAGFKDAIEYYTHCSSLQYLQSIKSPCKILFALDDPLINCSKLDEVSVPDHIEIKITQYGGHMGFLQNSFKNPFWMDEQLFHWLFLS